MNRCLPLPRPRPAARLFVKTFGPPLGLVALLLGLCIPVMAQSQAGLRPFPPAAHRGEMKVTSSSDLLIDGKPARLSPGARIRGTNNMLVISGALVGQSMVVNYVREPLGLVHEVWILNPAEIQAKPPAH